MAQKHTRILFVSRCLPDIQAGPAFERQGRGHLQLRQARPVHVAALASAPVPPDSPQGRALLDLCWDDSDRGAAAMDALLVWLLEPGTATMAALLDTAPWLEPVVADLVARTIITPLTFRLVAHADGICLTRIALSFR